MSEPVVPLTQEQAAELLLAPSSPYALARVPLDGVEFTVFQHAPRNLAALYALAARHDAREMLVYEDERYTYGEMRQRAANLAHHLVHEFGLRKGERVALVMRNYPEWCVSYVAATSIGAVVVPCNAWWTAAELRYGLVDSEARLVIADQERFERMQADLPQLGLRAIVARPSGALPAFAQDIAPLLLGQHATPVVAVDPEDDVTLFYTSGSTGEPKGVVSTHRAITNAIMTWEFLLIARLMMEMTGPAVDHVRAWLLGGAAALAKPAHDLPQSISLMTLPLFHVTGCNVQFLPAFRSGRKLVMMQKWNPERALELIERERINDFNGVPTMSWELVNSPDFAKRDTSSLRSLSAGGAARPPAHVNQLKAKAAHALPSTGYGMTETSGLGTAIGGDDYLARPGSVGRALPPLCELQVVDTDGRVLPIGQEGEICIKSVTNMRGYFKRPKETAQTLQHGWIQTGDLGSIDAEGFLFITGRAKDIVIRGGENISCAEVERALYEHTAVFEAAVYGVPDERLGEALAATIMLRAGEQLGAEQLQRHVAARLAQFKVPAHFFFQTEPLPRIASGKVDKRSLQRAAEAILVAPDSLRPPRY